MPRSFVSRLRLSWSLARLGSRYLRDGDSWRSREHDVPMHEYGPGNFAAGFQWYLEGPSKVQVTTVEEIVDWLCGCQYEKDAALFGRDDYWQHPTGFETLRTGDCEDHALWTWRKLIELGYFAELVVGWWEDPGAAHQGHHAWVVIREPGRDVLLECVAKERDSMLHVLADVRLQYHPHVSVDHKLRGRVYSGYCRWLLDEFSRRRMDRASRQTRKPQAAVERSEGAGKGMRSGAMPV